MGDLVPTDFDRHIRALPAEGGPSGAEWADRLPRLLRELLGEWGLVPSGPTRHGRCAVVVPVTAGHAAAILASGRLPREAAA